MLTKLLPEQISKFWDIIKYAIEESVPPTAYDHPDQTNRILAAALGGKVDVWASYDKRVRPIRLEGIALTQVLVDNISQTRNLLLYCIYGYEDVSSDTWFTGLTTLAKYAKGKGCRQIIAYTDRPAVVALAKSLGADTKYTFISFDVNEAINESNH